MSPSPTPVPLDYANVADLFTPIYLFLAIVLAIGIFYAVYAIIIRPWLRG